MTSDDKLNEIAKRYAADDRLWTTQETVEANLLRAIQEAMESNAEWLRRQSSELAIKLGEAAIKIADLQRQLEKEKAKWEGRWQPRECRRVNVGDKNTLNAWGYISPPQERNEHL